jgi:NAD(P) transhydrogenase
MDEFDLVVIGGGAAGEAGAVQAALAGKRVALVEKASVPGGAMVNTGTLPSKTLRETALYLSGFRQRGLHGVDLALGREATLDDFLFRLNAVVEIERRRLADDLARHGVTVFEGTARFVDAHSVSVDAARSLSAEFVLIATGSSPVRPALFEFDHRRVYDSDDIVHVHEIPESLAIVGAGVIGCEYACLFAALGTRVTLIDGRDALLPFLDQEMSALLRERMQALGIAFRFDTVVERCEPGRDAVRLTLPNGAAFSAGLALICAGRQANTCELALENAGLVAGGRGQLAVDADLRTAVPHIYAAGDVVGAPALASTSMQQARVAVCHAFGLRYKPAASALHPYGIYTIPEVSMVGETEAALRCAGIPYVAGVAEFSRNARGSIIGEAGRLKLLFRRQDMRLLGVHVLGEGASELVHVGLMAMLSEGTAESFVEACFNYPTLSESYKYAAYDALNHRGS